MDAVNEFLQKHKTIHNISGFTVRDVAPRMVCKDGFSMSVQVGECAYCSPRECDAYQYYKAEVGYPSAKEDLLMPYIDGEDNEPTDTVYGYVPVSVVCEIIETHGGLRA